MANPKMSDIQFVGRKVILDELKQLKRAERGVNRDLTEAEKRFTKELAAVKMARRNVKNARARLAKRRAILNGRLSA